MFRYSLVLIILLWSIESYSQLVTVGQKTTATFPTIVAGKNHLSPPVIPHITLIAPDTFIYKAEVEIVLGPDNINNIDDQFYTTGYMTNAVGYFHAYLVPPVNYAELKPSLDADYIVPIENRIYFKYVEKYNDVNALDYQLYDYKRAKKLTIFPLAIPTMGANYYMLDLQSLGLTMNDFYTLEVKNSKGEVGLLRIKFIKAE